MAIIDLPFQDRIEQSSSPNYEGYDVNIISYGGNVSQVSFNGANSESSRMEEWVVNWAFIEHATAAEVAGGAVDELGSIREFYKNAQLNNIRWRPFEYAANRIWRIKHQSLKIKPIGGCLFKASITLQFLYTE